MTPEQFMANFGAIAEAPEGLLRLREVVLSRAIRGALVEAEDGDARAEVAALQDALAGRVKNKEFRKNKAPSSTYEELRWRIPDHWEWARLDQLGAIGPRNSLDDGAAASFVPMPTVPEGFSGSISGTEDRPWKSIKKQYTHLADGDVALAKITPCFQNRKSVVVADLTGGFGAGTTELHVFRPAAPDLIDPRFVLVWLKSPEFVERGAGFMTGTAGQQRVPRDYFSASPFPFPPLAEQKRIVAKVDQLMAMLDDLEQRQEKKRTVAIHVSKASLDSLVNAEDPDQLARAWERVSKNFGVVAGADLSGLREVVLSLALRGRLTETSEATGAAEAELAAIREVGERLRIEKGVRAQKRVAERDRALPFSIPDSWTWTALEELCYQITDGTHYTPTYVEEGVPFLSVKDVSSGRLDFSRCKYVTEAAHVDLTSRCKPERDDLLLTKVGTTGICVLVDTDRPFSIFVSVALLKFPAQLVEPRFLEYCLNSPVCRQQSARHTRGVGNKNLVLKHIRGFQVPLPPREAQEHIVAKVDHLMAVLDDLRAKSAASEAAARRLAGVATVPSPL